MSANQVKVSFYVPLTILSLVFSSHELVAGFRGQLLRKLHFQKQPGFYWYTVCMFKYDM